MRQVNANFWQSIANAVKSNSAYFSKPINFNGQSNVMPTSALDVISRIQDQNLQNEYLYNYYGIKDQQAFAERMARNSYQYAVEDLKKAGLNPYMLYSNGGSGATTPSTSAFSASPYAGTVYASDNSLKGLMYSADLAYDASVDSAKIKAISNIATFGMNALVGLKT